MKLLLVHNQKVNLTGTTDPEQFLIRHVLDSLPAVPYIIGVSKAIDIGSGGGIPGIPLAILATTFLATALFAYRTSPTAG